MGKFSRGQIDDISLYFLGNRSWQISCKKRQNLFSGKKKKKKKKKTKQKKNNNKKTQTNKKPKKKYFNMSSAEKFYPVCLSLNTCGLGSEK